MRVFPANGSEWRGCHLFLLALFLFAVTAIFAITQYRTRDLFGYWLHLVFLVLMFITLVSAVAFWTIDRRRAKVALWIFAIAAFIGGFFFLVACGIT